ncbi:ComF family protein [Pseudomonas fluorescens]|uniref:ComF family protein n=1 Tax=Pseudomonas fluorescens TaxID=294 RepID=UPI001784FCC4|nr:ComF family protein [Pseudomonas fluorescens]MBD8147784.1 ComF family protein [Pseudomonas fluorescens]MBD8177318.1 ComF family protein [Pseudomonas fluorescens]MBD8746959.1 ComF family protein [Pseudomonas fluorescens]MBD8759745.1 ComF family protein [Pseudomonas fluorescens]MBD8764929.1 ComF family protein [Pseudomonas fluorescens]
MEVRIKKIEGSWDLGYVLHKHTLSSVHLGVDEWGHDRFENTRSEPGEALYQLKYRQDWSQVEPLAAQIQETLLPLFGNIGMIIPMPASTVRAKQPVNELASALGRLMGKPVFGQMIVKAAAPACSPALKNLHTRAEKDAALAGRITINEVITNDGQWNALLLDDLFDTGATMDAVCQALRTYRKINRIYAAAITWK